MERCSRPDKNKEMDVQMKQLKEHLHENKESNSADIEKIGVALESLVSYFRRRDAFLDYVLLYLKPLEDSE